MDDVDKLITISECIHKCPFFGTSMDGMECNNPYFDDKDAYENMIISQEDRGSIPKKCPLRKKVYTIVYIASIDFYNGE
jgi:hypothetical protein